MTRMDVTVYDDGDERPTSVWSVLVDAEKKIAQEEEREPEGWFWVEGMEGPKEIDFSEGPDA